MLTSPTLENTHMAERQRFADRTAIVTGAGGGIGEAYARALHAEGANVVMRWPTRSASVRCS